jgi:hypothetical protein
MDISVIQAKAENRREGHVLKRVQMAGKINKKVG